VFGRCCDAASESLLDVDMLCTLFILMVLDIKSDSSVADDFPRYPTDALQFQDFVGAIAECVVLQLVYQIPISASSLKPNSPG